MTSHRVLAADLASAVAQGGVDPTLEDRVLQDALRRAIASRRGYCSWYVDHAGWVVTLHSPDEQDFSGKTLEEGLAWCLVWLMFPEPGIGPLLIGTCSVERRRARWPCGAPGCPLHCDHKNPLPNN